ncbi:MAG TPA: enoyl-CoA hydratase-related protein [Burkholderiales bacterium]|nr:enoyl-CoA hydratase-related protein [Burkholderiales bacterium]
MNVKLEKQGGIATVTLDRADKMNALSEDMYVDVANIFGELQTDESVRAVILTGAGKAFCSGSDVGSMQGVTMVGNRPRMQLRHRMITNIVNLEKPVIAAVNGAAVGIGFSVALACDLIVAAESAKFSMLFKRIGLVPDGGAVFFLAQHLGIARAKELVYTARMLPAQEAREWGIATKVVPDAELIGAAQAFAGELAGSATYAIGLAKKMFQSVYVPSLEALLETEILTSTIARMTEDHKEGITAFAEKRKPQFKGR